ncbi:MAG: response regulator [Planctomycetota bacterium]|jgi:two-component system response regulator
MSPESHGDPIDILLVEDNPADVDLTMEAFKEAMIVNRVYVVNDGTDAMAFLRKDGEFAYAPRPGLIVLDLHLPKMDGHEVLKRIQEDENLRDIPVAVLTSSKEDEDIIDAFYHQAKCYITKPIDMNMFFVTLRTIGAFGWAIVSDPEGGEVEEGEEEGEEGGS